MSYSPKKHMQTMTLTESYLELLSKYKYIGLVLAVLFANPSLFSLTFGIAITLVGLAFKLYSIIHKHKSDELFESTQDKAFYFYKSGPYRYLRHPYEFGEFLSLMGVAIATGVSAIIVIALLFLGFEAGAKSNLEEKSRIDTYKDDYRYYMKKTSKFIPSKIPTIKELSRASISSSIRLDLKSLTLIGVSILTIAVVKF